MINYSIQLRNRYVTVNGTKTKKAYAYAKAKDRGTVDETTFLHDCATKSKYGAGMFAEIVQAVAKTIIAKIKLGYIVDAGALGKFKGAISSNGVLDIAEFSAATDIKKSYVSWVKPTNLATLLKEGDKRPDFSYEETNADKAALKTASKNVSATATMPTSSARTLMRTQQAAIDSQNS